MPRTSLSSLVATVQTAIKADAWFSGVPVMRYTGSEENDIETATAETGFAVVLNPITDVMREDTGRGAALVTARFTIEVLENPEINSNRLAKDHLEGVAKVTSIVLGIDAGPGDVRPDSTTKIAELIVLDDGLRCYRLIFDKLVQLS